MAITGTTWVTTTAPLFARYTEKKIAEISDDTTSEPSSYSSANSDANLSAAIQDAEAEIKTALNGRYSSAITAGTASNQITSYVCSLTLFYLYRRRSSIPIDIETQANQVRDHLQAIMDRKEHVTDWSDGAQYSIEKVEFQRLEDVYEGAVDSGSIPDEHDWDER